MDWSHILGAGASLAGMGMGAASQGQQDQILQNALNTIGPTQLQGYTLAGPGGMSAGYNPSGGASIGLGSMSPAFDALVGGGSAGAGAYSPALLAGLTGGAAATLNPALANLSSAYGGNGLFQRLAATQAGNLGQTYGDIYGNTLANMRAQAAPGIQQQAYGLQNTLFGRGVADSTGAASGSLAAQNFGRGVAQGDASMQLAAQQAALSGMNTQAGIASSLSGTGNSLLSNAFANFGNTNQLISGLNSAQLNNSISALQGAGALNTLGLNNYMAALQTGSAQANAKNLSLFPYAGVATSLAGTPTPMGMFAGGLSQMGASGMGSSGWGGVLNGLGGVLNNWFGGGGGMSSSDAANWASGSMADSALTDAGFGSDSGGGFSGAGGQAAGSSLGGYASGVGDAYGIYSGVKSGTPQGYAKAGMDAYKLYNTASGLMGGAAGLGAYGSGAAADAAVTSALGSVGAQTAGTSASIAAANSAALGGSTAASGAASGAGASAGTGAGSSALGVAGALAIPAAIVALGFMGDEGDYGVKNISSILGQVQAGTQAGYINPNGSIVDPTSNAGWRAITALNQSQLGPGGSYGKYSAFGTQGLNALGYQTLQQQAKALSINGAGLGGGGGLGYGSKVLSF